MKNSEEVPRVNIEFDSFGIANLQMKIFHKHPRNDKYLNIEFYWIVFLCSMSPQCVFF